MRSKKSFKDWLWTFGPSVILLLAALALVYQFVDPAPPHRIIISTGDGEGDYQSYAKQYRDLIKEDGVELEIRASSGASENVQRLKDPKSDVDVGFVHDGAITSETAPDLVSLGSLYYEPFWVFYRANSELTRLSQLQGKRIAVGEEGSGTHSLAMRLLRLSGVDDKNSRLVLTSWEASATALQRGEIDAAVFLGTPEEAIIKKLVALKPVRLMSMDQAEAISRQIPFLHHLVLPHGALNLKLGLPERDIDLVAPTATLVARDTLHPALIYLLLKAASQVHDEPGIFEKKNEFPSDKAYELPMADEAKQFFKSGTPFWQRYLPFWIATLLERFLIVMLPLIAVALPLIRSIPKFMQWRLRSRLYQRYGELKFLETRIKAEKDISPHRLEHHLKELDAIEERVNHMKVPLDFSDHVYVLREHIQFVRERLERFLNEKNALT